MRYDLLTVELLREIARRHGLPTAGTKPQLIDRLQRITMPPATTAATWLLYTEQRLDAFIAALGLDATGATTKQLKATLLETVPDLTPNHALTAMLAQPSQGAKVELQLTKQANTEKPEAFIARARTHFQLVSATDTEAITLLVNAASPPIAAFMTENIQAGVTTKEAIMKLVLDRFAPNPFQYHQQFRRYKLTPAQSAQEAGMELRRLYIGFLNISKADVPTYELVINKTVTAQLLDILPPSAAMALRTELLRQPDKTWDDIVQLADHVLQVAPKTTVNSGTAATGGRQFFNCKVHGRCGHTDAQCYQQKDASKQSRGTDQCYTCHQYGHMTRDCPLNNRKKPGNADTESG